MVAQAGSGRVSAGRDAAVVAALVLVGVAFFWRYTLAGQAPYWEDLLLYFYPMARVGTGAGFGFSMLWNPFVFCGAPLAANPQAFTFLPFRLLFFLLPLDRAMTWLLVGHIVGAGAAMYLFLRLLRHGPVSALLGGVVFMLGAPLSGHFSHVTMILAMAWIPLLLASAELVLQGGRIPGVVLGGLASGMQFLAGHVQTWYITVLLAVVYTLGRSALECQRRSWRPMVSHLTLVVASVGAGLALAAVQVLPMLEMVGRRARPQDPYAFATMYSLAPRQLIRIIAPGFFGTPDANDFWGEWSYWDLGSYLGIIPLLLSVQALVFSRRRERFVFLALALLGVALALGAYFPVYAVAYRIVPLLGIFRVPARFLLWVSVSLAALSAMGLEALVTPMSRLSPRRQNAAAWVLVASWAVLAPVGGLLWLEAQALKDAPEAALRTWLFRPSQWWGHSPWRTLGEVGWHIASRSQQSVTATLVWATAAGITVAALLIPGMFGRLAPLLVVAVSAADLAAAGASFHVATSPAVIRQPPSILRYLGPTGVEGPRVYVVSTLHHAVVRHHFAHSGFGSSDPAFLEEVKTALVPNIPALYGVVGVLGYDPLVNKDVALVLAAMDRQLRQDGASSLLDFAGGRWVLSDRSMAGPGFRFVLAMGRVRLFENTKAFPKLWAVHQYEVVASPKQAVERIVGGADLRVMALVQGAPFSGQRLPTEPLRWQATVSQYLPDRVTAKVVLSRPAVVVMNDTYDPGWRAFANGKPVKIFQANGSFRAVALPAGETWLEFVYRPRAVLAGGVVSALTLMVVASLAVWQVLKAQQVRKRQEDVSGPCHSC